MRATAKSAERRSLQSGRGINPTEAVTGYANSAAAGGPPWLRSVMPPACGCELGCQQHSQGRLRPQILGYTRIRHSHIHLWRRAGSLPNTHLLRNRPCISQTVECGVAHNGSATPMPIHSESKAFASRKSFLGDIRDKMHTSPFLGQIGLESADPSYYNNFCTDNLRFALQGH